MTIVAALYDPSTVLVADDLADVVTPDDDRANGWATGIWQRRRAPIARHGHPGQAYRTGLALADGFAERLIGSIRRECVDHIIVLGEVHLRRILRSYTRYNASVIGQRRAGFSPSSADRKHQFIRDTWWYSPSLRPGLGFRYAQAPAGQP